MKIALKMVAWQRLVLTSMTNPASAQVFPARQRRPHNITLILAFDVRTRRCQATILSAIFTLHLLP